jgi:hypothetical protein
MVAFSMHPWYKPGRHDHVSHLLIRAFHSPPLPALPQIFYYTQSHGASVAAAPAFLQVADE